MTGFESFQLTSWLDGALVIFTDKVEKVGRATKRAGAVVVAASTLTASLCALAGPSQVAEVGAYVAASIPGGLAEPRADSEVPPGYWPGLLAAMKTWKAAPADDDDLGNLDPLI